MDLTELFYQTDRFQGLEAADIDTLERVFDVRHYADGHRFCTKPAQACAMHLLVSGQVEVAYRPIDHHHAVWTQRLGPGDFFGCHGDDHSDPARIDEIARGPVMVATLPHQACALLLHGHSPLADRFQQLFHDCIHRQTRHPGAAEQAHDGATITRIPHHHGG